MKQKQNRIRTGDLALMKALNSAIVLNCIRKSQPVSRAAVARLCGLNRATVSSIVAELIEGHLVVEAGAGQSCGGRKPIMLRFHGAAALAVGVEIGVNSAHILACDLAGRVRSRKQVSFHAPAGVEQVMAQVAAATAEALKDAPGTPLGLAGIGVGVPGFVHSATERLIFAPNLGWRDIDVGAYFSDAFGCPVVVENEANAGALGEMWFGSARGAGDFIYLSVGVGLGAGVVLNGELFRGSDGYAGEMGHTVIDPAGPLCSCGNRGCWEALASEGALLRYAGEAGLPAGAAGTLKQIAALAAAGDRRALAAFTRAGLSLGAGIANAVNIFNPTLVVIGSTMAAGLPFMQPVIEETVRAKALPRLSSGMRIIPAALDDNCALGGAAAVLQAMLQIPRLDQPINIYSEEA